MSVTDPKPVQSSALIARVQGILTQPTAEWAVIEAEPATVGGLYSGYVAILAAIPAIAGLIGGLVFGHRMLFVSWRPSPISALVWAVVGYALALAMVFVMALIID